MEHTNYLYIILIGAFTGFTSGMFGVGGALIGTPLLRIIVGLPPYLALATPLPVAIPSGISGSMAYYKKKLINFNIAKYVLLGAIPVNILGTYATKFAGGKFLMILTGLFLFIVGGSFIIRGWLLKEEKKEEKNNIPASIFTGVITGFLAGFLAVGGGIVMVPAFVRINHMELKRALATSLFCVTILSIPASMGHFLLGHIDIYTALILSIAVIPMSYLGAKCAISLKNKTLEKIYGIFLLIFAIYFTCKHF